MNRLLIFGAGYAARQCAVAAKESFHRIAGTTRSADNFAQLRQAGISPQVFSGDLASGLDAVIGVVTHLLVSAGPDEAGDPVLRAARASLLQSQQLRWICYLSTVGVYGDHGGAWVDEDTPCRPAAKRSVERLAAESAWAAFAKDKGVPLSIFRLSGIYGPGRNALDNAADGTARRLVKPGQVFNRIHRDDIAAAFVAAANIEAGGIFNITDDEPAPPQDVVAFAHELMGLPAPPEQEFSSAELSPMARSFYGENKRVSNAKSKRVLGMIYAYPDYRTALKKMWVEGSWKE